MKINKDFINKYRFYFYVLRWMILAIPGALLLDMALKLNLGFYITMILTQGILGALNYPVDKTIIAGK